MTKFKFSIDFKYQILLTLFVTSLVISNVVSTKILQIGPLVIPGAAVCYCITFLCTDIISELYGKQAAKQAVYIGFVCQLMATLLILLTRFLPHAEFAGDVANAYIVLLGTNWRLFLASMAGYFVSQSWDVWLFHKLKDKTKGKHKWLRNNASTMTSQLIDTIIFITIAFAGIVPELGVMIISQYVFKVVLAALDTPVFYLLTRGSHKQVTHE